MKGYTDLEQSKKLAEILPVESADMSFVEKGNAKRTWYDAENSRITTAYEKKYYIPCWSLVALLDILIAKDFNPETMFLRSTSDGHGTRLTNVWRLSVDRLDVDITLRDTYADNLVDACYEMILKLNELKIL